MSRNYIFHIPKTNLASRTDDLAGQSESFLYDNLDRLTKCYTPIRNIAYATNGNISSKTEGGTYTYDATKVHAVTWVTKTAGTSSQPLQNISYTKFNKALSITQYLKTSPPKTLTYDITYGPDQQRVKTFYTDTSGYKTIRYYSGSYQKDSIVVGSTKTVKKIHYIMGGTGLVAVYIKWSTGVEKMYYVCKDRQGSIMALVNQDGTIAEKYSYDAWGRRRNPANWTDFNVKTPRLISRGYTGHEYLDAFGLINMNGRMYDPVIGRVLSPDNYVQDPTNTQSYNRYSYCLNNPLRYTDPSGWFAAAADQYWNMGKDITDFISFSGMRAGSLDGTGGGQGWGGVGGVVPQGIHWMPRDIKIDDLQSLYDVTPSNGKLYTYTNVNGDWYNTSTSTIKFRYSFIPSMNQYVQDQSAIVAGPGGIISKGSVPKGGVMFYSESGHLLFASKEGNSNIIYTIPNKNINALMRKVNAYTNYWKQPRACIDCNDFSKSDYFQNLANTYSDDSYSAYVVNGAVKGSINAPWYMYVAAAISISGEGFAAGYAKYSTQDKGLRETYSLSTEYGIKNYWVKYFEVKTFDPWW